MAPGGQPAARPDAHGPKTSKGSDKPRKPRPTDLRNRARPERPADSRSRLYSRVWPPYCVLTRECEGFMADAIHYLCRLLEDREEYLFRSLEKAFGVWVLVNGVWERRIHLDAFFNMEIMCSHLHNALDGRQGLFSGFIAFYPINPTLKECVRRVRENQKKGRNYEELFPEASLNCIVYTLFVFDGKQLTIAVYDEPPRTYPIPDDDDDDDDNDRPKFYKAQSEPTSNKLVHLPNYDWTFTSHLNPVVVIVDLRRKLEFRHGKAPPSEWDTPRAAEVKLYESLCPATDYVFDKNSWPGAPPPPKKGALTLRANPPRSVRLAGIRTNAAPSKIPVLDSDKSSNMRKGRPRTIATVPDQSSSRLPRHRTSLAAESSGRTKPPQRSTPPRTRSQSRKLASKDAAANDRLRTTRY